MSKFKGILDAKRDTTSDTTAEPQADNSRRGRPTGKRSDPEYLQATVYLKKKTHQDVKVALLQEGQQREFSELVEELLADWLKSRS